MALSSQQAGAPSRVQKPLAASQSSHLKPKLKSKPHPHKLIHDAELHLRSSPPNLRLNLTLARKGARKEARKGRDRCVLIMDNQNGNGNGNGNGKKKVVAKMAGNSKGSGNALGIVRKYETAGTGEGSSSRKKSVIGSSGKEKEKDIEMSNGKGKGKEAVRKTSKIIAEVAALADEIETLEPDAFKKRLEAVDAMLDDTLEDTKRLSQGLGGTEAVSSPTKGPIRGKFSPGSSKGGDKKGGGKEGPGKKATTIEEAKSPKSAADGTRKPSTGDPSTYVNGVEGLTASALNSMIDSEIRRRARVLARSDKAVEDFLKGPIKGKSLPSRSKGGDAKVARKEGSGNNATNIEKVKSQLSVVKSTLKVANGNPVEIAMNAIKATTNMDPVSWANSLEQPEAQELKLMIEDAERRYREREGGTKAGAMESSTQGSIKGNSLPGPSNADTKFVGKEESEENSTAIEEAKSQMSVIESAMKVATGDRLEAALSAVNATNIDPLTFLQMLVKPEAKNLRTMFEEATGLVYGEDHPDVETVPPPEENKQNVEFGDAAKAGPSKGRDAKVVGHEGSAKKAKARKRPKTILKRGPKSKTRRRISDITFTNVPMGSSPDFVVLRCNETCPKREEVDGSDLGQAHMWCMTHSIYHCIRNEGCREFVLCGVAFPSFITMRIDRHEDALNGQEGVATGAGDGDQERSGDDYAMKKSDSGFSEASSETLRDDPGQGGGCTCSLP